MFKINNYCFPKRDVFKFILYSSKYFAQDFDNITNYFIFNLLISVFNYGKLIDKKNDSHILLGNMNLK